METNNTVVYRHVKPCGEVFYVGIGNEKRPYSKDSRNQFWHNVVKKYPDYGVEVVATGLCWETACELEELMILEYVRRDLGTGTLVNLTNGGDGVKNPSEETRQKMGAARKGKVVSKESRQKMSTAQKGKKLTKETRQKIGAAQSGENSPWYGKKITEEHRRKIGAANKGNIPANRKLTFKQAQEIRHLYQTEKISIRKLGQKYGVSHNTIGYIIKNKIYLKPE